MLEVTQFESYTFSALGKNFIFGLENLLVMAEHKTGQLKVTKAQKRRRQKPVAECYRIN